MSRTRRASLGRNYHRVYTASVISNLGDGVALIAVSYTHLTLPTNREV